MSHVRCFRAFQSFEERKECLGAFSSCAPFSKIRPHFAHHCLCARLPPLPGLRETLRAARRAGLDLPGAQAHHHVRDEGVLRLAGPGVEQPMDALRSNL